MSTITSSIAKIFRWIVNFSIGVIEIIKERSNIEKSVIVTVSFCLVESYCHKNTDVSVYEEFIVFHNVIVKWYIELFRGEK
jgi:hypothetical protein